MKVLFVSKELKGTSGAGVLARMHLNSLYSIVGKENVFVIDVGVTSKPKRSDNYISYGKYPCKFNRVVRHLQGNTFYFSNAIIKEICGIVGDKKIDFVFIDDSFFGNLVKSLKKRFPNVAVVTFYHDVKASLFRKWKVYANIWQRINYNIGLRQEKISFMNTDANIVLNQNENKLLKKYYGKNTDFYLPVCVPKEESNVENPYKGGKKHILFVGTMYHPNLVGIRWFYDNVFLKIQSKFDFWVVGKDLDSLQKEYDNGNVHMVGFVDSLSPYYRYADVVIAPLTDGGGMKIKTAEAISYGKTFVGTTESLYGYYEEIPDFLKNSKIFRCDTEVEFLNCFQRLAREDIEKCNLDLVHLYEEKYSPRASVEIVSYIMKVTKR